MAQVSANGVAGLNIEYTVAHTLSERRRREFVALEVVGLIGPLSRKSRESAEASVESFWFGLGCSGNWRKFLLLVSGQSLQHLNVKSVNHTLPRRTYHTRLHLISFLLPSPSEVAISIALGQVQARTQRAQLGSEA